MKRIASHVMDVSFNCVNYFVLAVFTLICIYPFYYVFIYSISDPNLAKEGVLFLPKGLTFFNYMRILTFTDIYRSFAISAVRTLAGTVTSVFCSSMFAYVISKKELYARNFIYRFAVITMYINSGLIPYYLTIKAYGLRNSLLVYIIPSAVNVFFMILFKTFIEQLPASLEESAMIDGAGYFKRFVLIVFPLSTPIVGTIAVFAAVGNWSSWFDTYIFISDKKLFTLQYVLLQYLQEAQRLADSIRTNTSAAVNTAQMTKLTPESTRMTITMLAALPILLVYPFMQRYFVKGIMLGAIKG